MVLAEGARDAATSGAMPGAASVTIGCFVLAVLFLFGQPGSAPPRTLSPPCGETVWLAVAVLAIWTLTAYN